MQAELNTMLDLAEALGGEFNLKVLGLRQVEADIAEETDKTERLYERKRSAVGGPRVRASRPGRAQGARRQYRPCAGHTNNTEALETLPRSRASGTARLSPGPVRLAGAPNRRAMATRRGHTSALSLLAPASVATQKRLGKPKTTISSPARSSAPCCPTTSSPARCACARRERAGACQKGGSRRTSCAGTGTLVVLPWKPPADFRARCGSR